MKGDSRTAISNARKSIRSVFGRGIVATETLFEPDHDIPAIPVPVMLAALQASPERRIISS